MTVCCLLIYSKNIQQLKKVVTSEGGGKGKEKKAYRVSVVYVNIFLKLISVEI